MITKYRYEPCSDSDFEDYKIVIPRRKKMKKGKVWWSVRPSRVKTDPLFNNLPVGLGVFSTRNIPMNMKGRFEIKFNGLHVYKTTMTSLQRRYAIESGYDEDYVVVPSHDDIISGRIGFSWRINHNSHNPTHKLCWDDTVGDEHPYLEPLRKIKIGQEITFDYKLKK